MKRVKKIKTKTKKMAKEIHRGNVQMRDRDREIAKPTATAAVMACAPTTTKFKQNDMKNFVWLFIVRR